MRWWSISRPTAVEQGLARGLALTIAVLFAFVGCSSSGTSASADTAPRGDTGGEFGVEALRRQHPVTGEGTSCADDRTCSSPLRCLGGTCGFPPAMTGQHDASTPAVLFHAPSGVSRYWLEIAAADHEKTRGLMHRHVLHPEFGMLFVYDVEDELVFWMKNTWVPLDMVHVDDGGRVVAVVANAEPKTLTPRSGGVPARYVIELRAGEAEARGIVRGTEVEFRNVPEPYLPRRR